MYIIMLYCALIHTLTNASYLKCVLSDTHVLSTFYAYYLNYCLMLYNNVVDVFNSTLYQFDKKAEVCFDSELYPSLKFVLIIVNFVLQQARVSDTYLCQWF